MRQGRTFFFGHGEARPMMVQVAGDSNNAILHPVAVEEQVRLTVSITCTTTTTTTTTTTKR
eukprot:scaffold1160_cov153-Amphora_coffeaeformis.AAC.4